MFDTIKKVDFSLFFFNQNSIIIMCYDKFINWNYNLILLFIFITKFLNKDKIDYDLSVYKSY